LGNKPDSSIIGVSTENKSNGDQAPPTMLLPKLMWRPRHWKLPRWSMHENAIKTLTTTMVDT
jgi:hypothetical protein